MATRRGLRGISSETAKTPYTGVPSKDSDETKYERPWQRVPSPFMFLVLGFYFLVAYCCQLLEDAMPTVILDSDIGVNDSTTFSEQSALRHLDVILGDQPRVAGTPYHLQKTQDLKMLLDDIASRAKTPVRTDWQFVSGDYWIQFKIPHVNLYQNLSNIIAVLEGESGFNPDGSTRTSLLVNCHYDSVPFALGASDNGVFCAAMVETLSRLSRRNKKFKHNIVFLFNGAEELPLMASHGFISHPWFKGVTNVVNLDSGGMNGKAQVFQVTDPRMMKSYKGTRWPTGQGIGQFLFQSGIIPSDTDFRIWRDFGDIRGIDIAFIKWGHVYHTRNDNKDWLLPGVVQCAGDMLLSLVTNLADDEELRTKEPPSSAVYYDYLNVALMSYSERVAALVDSLVCVLALLSLVYYVWIVGYRLSTFQELLWALCGRLISLVVGLLVVAIFVVIMVATTIQMRYLSQPWIIGALYWLPYLIGATAAAQMFDSWRTKKTGLNRSIRATQAGTATRVLVTVALVALLVSPNTSNVRYLLSVTLACMSASSAIVLTALRYFRFSGWHHLILEVVLSIPSVAMLLTLGLRLLALLLPVTGRLPSVEPDYIIAAASCLFCVLAVVPVSGIELLFSRRYNWAVLSTLSVACLVAMFVPFSPYQDEGVAVQRHNWFHTEIVSYNQNGTPIERTSGVLITKWDTNNIESARTALKNSGLNSKVSLAADCEKHPFCNLPLYRPRLGEYLKDSLFVYMEAPKQFEHSLRLQSKNCDRDICQMNFVMTGPPHNTIIIVPHSNVTLYNWSFASPLKETDRHNSKPVYLITHATATYSDSPEPLEFSLTLIVPPELQSQPMVSISHDAHKIQHPDDFSQSFKTLMDSMPKYFNIAPVICFKSNYEF